MRLNDSFPRANGS